MKCEHCGNQAMRYWIICKKCWHIFMNEVPIPKGEKND